LSAQKQPAAQPPRGSSQGHSPPQNEQYGNKPPPPLPRQDNNQLRSSSYEGSGQRRQPSPDYRNNAYGGSGLGKQQPPLVPQQGNYAYSSSPPSNNGRFPPPTLTQARPPPHTPRPPASPAPGGGTADPSLLPLFRAVDKNGRLSPTPRCLHTAPNLTYQTH
jgi:peflin